MAEAAAPNDPELNIVLFDVHSSDKVHKRDRLESLEFVLTQVNQTCRGPLFVLCQENIDDDKHDILMKKLGDGHRPNKEVGLYYRSEDVTYALQRVDVEKEAGVLAFKFPGNDLRLVAYALTRRLRKILLVSWHGPCNVKDEGYKLAVFQTLVCLLDTLRVREKYHVVVVGGNFNLSDHLARRCLHQLGHLDGAVLSDYVATSDRRDQPIEDYIVSWPRGPLQVLETLVICRGHMREKWNHTMEKKWKRREGQTSGKVGRPFNHPIVAYKLAFANRDSAGPTPDQLPQPTMQTGNETAPDSSEGSCQSDKNGNTSALEEADDPPASQSDSDQDDVAESFNLLGL